MPLFRVKICMLTSQPIHETLLQTIAIPAHPVPNTVNKSNAIGFSPKKESLTKKCATGKNRNISEIISTNK